MARTFLSKNIRGNDILIYDEEREGFVNVNIDSLERFSIQQYIKQVEEFNDQKYMSRSESVTPIADSEISLGANGARFAKIYAVTFQGSATHAFKADTISKKNAKDGESLVWSDEQADWVPAEVLSGSLSELRDIDFANLGNESVLLYNNVRNLWEAVPADYLKEENNNDYKITDLNGLDVIVDNGRYQRFELSTNKTLTFDVTGYDRTDAIEITLIIETNGTKKIKWPENITWQGDVPSLEKGQNVIEVFSYNGGETWGGFLKAVI